MAKKRPTRGQLKNRANRKAEAGAAAQQAALDKQRQQAYHTYNTELGASRGAKRANKKLLAQAQAGIPGNIHGLALKQIQADLAGRVEDAKGMVRYEKPQLRADLNAALTSIQTDQANLDAQTAANAQSYLHDALKKQADKRKAEIEKRTKYNREVQSALAEIRNAVNKTRGDSITAHNVERKALSADPQLRRNLVDYLTTSQGISNPAAKKAVSLYSQQREGKKRSTPKRVIDQVNYGVGAMLAATTGQNADNYFNDLPWRRTYGPDDWGG